MAIDLETLVTAPTFESVRSDITAILNAVNFPATAWRATQAGAGFIDAISYIAYEVRSKAALVAQFCLPQYATGDTLTASALQNYQQTREPARATIGNVVVYGTGTVAEGDPIVYSGTQVYASTGAYTLDANGVIVEVESIDLGEIGNHSGQTLASANGNFTIIASNGYDWITTLGLNEETDDRLRQRCLAYPLSRAPSGPTEFYQYWALKTDPSITRVRVITRNYSSYGYHVEVRLATDFGPATSAQIAAIQAVYNTKQVHGIIPYASAAVSTPIVLTGFVYGRTAQDLANSLNALLRSHPAGEPLYDEQILDAIGGRRATVRYADGRALTSGLSLAASDVYTLTNLIQVMP
jgi:hypothetical protein